MILNNSFKNPLKRNLDYGNFIDKVKRRKEIKRIFEQSNDAKDSKKWSVKYKRSIDCDNPKGFSQKQYCKRKNKGEKYRS